MHRLSLCCLIAALLLTGLGCSQADGIQEQTEAGTGTNADSGKAGIPEIDNRFAFHLYRQLQAEEGNLLFSPASMKFALAMTYAGARGETRSEMADILNVGRSDDLMHDRMRALLSRWNSIPSRSGVQLHSANRLWGQEAVQFEEMFLGLTREMYGSRLEQLDFSQQEEARLKINQWIEEKTRGNILDLIPEGSINPNTQLVLTNAVYFNGKWSIPFRKTRTRAGKFHVGPNRTVQVPLMHHSGRYREGQFDGLQIAELPYGNGRFSMLVLLPDDVGGLAGIEQMLTRDNLAAWTDGLKEKDLILTLPRFQTTCAPKMIRHLKSMGMVSAFEAEKADFSGMTSGQELYISEVIHEATINVSELGTEASAASAVIAARPSAAGTRKKEFRVDRPFLYLIRDRESGSILFMGRMINPSDQMET